MRNNINFEPLKPLDIDDCKDVMELFDMMAQTSFGGREVGRAWAVLKDVVNDPDCGLILTISGAMTVAKLGRVFGSLISKSIIHAVITTGAVVTHSFVEELGMDHYKAPFNVTDDELYARKLNRIYDSIEPESNLEALEKFVYKAFSGLDPKNRYGSFQIIRHITAEMLKDNEPKGFLGIAHNHNVNIYVPALSDSELGLYLLRYTQHHSSHQSKYMLYDPIKDMTEYEKWICSQKKVAFLNLGGGVPRNWGQQMLSFLRSQQELGNLSAEVDLPKVIAAVRICPDAQELGHLSGSTYSEGISWGKFDPEFKHNFVEICCDVTILFPILAKALIDYVRNFRCF